MNSLPTLRSLRKTLHENGEPSGAEHKTKALLKAFLQAHTDLTLHPCGDGFYAAHREGAGLPGVAFRADYDALPVPAGGAAHLCGHDGHAAALCGVGMALTGRRVGKNVFLLFQPAEETGDGAKACLGLFERERVAEIYGAHNLPGWPLGQVVTRPGTFACASHGLTLRFTGRPAHAAYPENGVSPATALGTLLYRLPELSKQERFSGMTLCTVAGAALGEKTFGTAAAAGEVWLTLRAWHDQDLARLEAAVRNEGERLAKDAGLGFAYERQDVFPATENHGACAQKVLERCHGALLGEPMRWSEDFGWYLQRCPGAFFGVGAGESHPPLHTAGYEYPDELLGPTVEAFLYLLEMETGESDT